MFITDGARPRRQAGLTLIELIMFIVIVSAALAGVLSVLNLTSGRSADPMIQKQMLAIAEALLEEVSLAPFTYCDPDDVNAATAVMPDACDSTKEELGPEGEVRGGSPPFDNVNDYFVAGGLAVAGDISGTNALPAGYGATITIDGGTVGTPISLGPAGAAVTSDGTGDNMNLLRIAVTVTYGGQTLVLEGYRTRHSPNTLP